GGRMEWEFPTADELATLCEAAAVAPEDRRRLEHALRGLGVTAAELGACMERHMDLEVELAWLASKYERLLHYAEEDAAAHRAQRVTELRQETGGTTQWSITAQADAEPGYRAKLQRAIDVRRVAGLLDKLHGSLRRRESVLKGLSFRDRGFGEG